MNIVIINTFNIKSVERKVSIPINEITKVQVKKSFIPSRRVIIIHTKDLKIKISVMLNSMGCDITDQKENAECLIEKLLEI